MAFVAGHAKIVQAFADVKDNSDSGQFGAIQRMDQKTGQSRSIRYSRPQGQEALRWNWMSPIMLSPHNPEVVYHGANVLLRTLLALDAELA